jgi:serine/threonine protein kinase/WD40 repeat protein
MTEVPQPRADEADLFDFVATFLRDREDGQELPLADYQKRYPGREAEIAREHQRLCSEASSPLAAAAATVHRIGPYQVIRQLGSGGQGVVLLAEDTRLRRRVALKVLAPHLDFVSSERLQRFRREAEILSQLDHPGICQVYEADAQDGVPYLAMRYVDGQSLAALLHERRQKGQLPRTRRDVHEVMGFIEAAARAVHEAHEHGIVHRDIKPGNLMITAEGQPVLLDFGLARQSSTEDLQITRAGDVFGTLSYMAPEILQARPADWRADVYALGVTLFECLTHQLPFASKSQAELLRAIEQGDAVPPQRLNDAVPHDLAVVVATAIARNPSQRYATAAAFADDLARVRTREPILARRTRLHLRLLRWTQRHPTLATATLVCIASVIGLLLAFSRLSANERAASALHRALQATGTEEGATAALIDLLAAEKRSPRPALRDAMWTVLDGNHLAWQSPRTPVPALQVDPSPTFDPTGRLVAESDAHGFVTLRQARTGALVRRQRVLNGAGSDLEFMSKDRLLAATGHSLRIVSVPDLATVQSLALPMVEPITDSARVAATVSPDGATIALGLPGAIWLLDSRTLVRQAEIELSAAVAVRHIEFAPGGAHIAVLGRSMGADPHACTHAWIVELQSRRTVYCMPVETEGTLWLAWHPSGAQFVLTGNGGTVRVRDSHDGALRFERAAGQEVNWCGFDPSGRALLVPTDRGTDVFAWQDSHAPPIAHFDHPSERTIGSASFAPDGSRFACVLRDGSMLIFATADWTLLRQSRHRVRDARWLAWLPDGSALLTADMDHTTAWATGVRSHLPELRGHRSAVTSIESNATGTRWVSAARDGTARIWAIDRADALHVLDHQNSPVMRATFSPDGTRVLTIAADGVVRIFDAEGGACLHQRRDHDGHATDARFLGTSGQFVSVGDDGRAIVYDLANGGVLHEWHPSDAPVRSLDYDAGRRWLALGGADRHVTVLDCATGAMVRRIDVSREIDDWRVNPLHQVRGIAFDHERGELFASLVNNYLMQWKLEDWSCQQVRNDMFGGPLAVDPRSGRVVCADYSFGRASLAGEGAFQQMTVDGRSAHSNRIAAVEVAPGGGFALTAGHDGQLFVWDLAARAPIQSLRTGSAILDASFSGDGRWIATACADGAIKLWPRDPVATAHEYLERRERARER